VESLDPLLLQLLELARMTACLEEWARHARRVVLLIAIGTLDAKVGAARIFAIGCVLGVVGGEMVARALIAVRFPGSANVRRVAPFEARGALACCRGNGPWEASSDDANE
jgi:hypothetical protein